MENTGSHDPGGKLILLGEDDKTMMEALDTALHKEGFRLAKAADGDEAIDKARTLRPDLILLDLMLPRRSGFEVLREFRDEAAEIPVVILTGCYSDPTTVGMLRQEPNVKDFLLKPVELRTLADRLHALLGTRRPA